MVPLNFKEDLENNSTTINYARRTCEKLNLALKERAWTFIEDKLECLVLGCIGQKKKISEELQNATLKCETTTINQTKIHKWSTSSKKCWSGGMS